VSPRITRPSSVAYSRPDSYSPQAHQPGSFSARPPGRDTFRKQASESLSRKNKAAPEQNPAKTAAALPIRKTLSSSIAGPLCPRANNTPIPNATEPAIASANIRGGSDRNQSECRFPAVWLYRALKGFQPGAI